LKARHYPTIDERLHIDDWAITIPFALRRRSIRSHRFGHGTMNLHEAHSSSRASDEFVHLRSNTLDGAAR
jgi:hypothetical protein